MLASEHHLDNKDLNRCQQALKSYPPQTQAILIYGGNSPDKTFKTTAKQQHIELKSWLNYQGLLDFTDYLNRQQQDLSNNSHYQQKRYIKQQLCYDKEQKESALDTVLDGRMPVRFHG